MHPAHMSRLAPGEVPSTLNPTPMTEAQREAHGRMETADERKRRMTRERVARHRSARKTDLAQVEEDFPLTDAMRSYLSAFDRYLIGDATEAERTEAFRAL